MQERLEQWLKRKRAEVARLARLDIRRLTPSIKDFHHAISTQRGALAVVVELSRETPEEGTLAASLPLPALVQAADEAAVSAFAVPIDALACGGSVETLADVAKLTLTPIASRDLVLVPEQVYLARLAGADAVLLSASVADASSLRRFLELAASTHMAAPVEVRTAAELESALAAGARILVVPAFAADGSLDLSAAEALLPRVPRHLTPLVRGPFGSAAQVEVLRGKADGVWLCGPYVRAPDKAAFLGPLVQAAEGS